MVNTRLCPNLWLVVYDCCYCTQCFCNNDHSTVTNYQLSALRIELELKHKGLWFCASRIFPDFHEKIWLSIKKNLKKGVELPGTFSDKTTHHVFHEKVHQSAVLLIIIAHGFLIYSFILVRVKGAAGADPSYLFERWGTLFTSPSQGQIYRETHAHSHSHP